MALRSSATGWVSIQVQGEVPNIAGITLPEEVRHVATVQHTDDVRADAIAYMLRVISRYTYTHDHIYIYMYTYSYVYLINCIYMIMIGHILGSFAQVLV